MKAITLKAPWAYAVAHLGKRVENRSWRPRAALIGQRVAIHAGATWTARDLVAVLDALAATGRHVDWVDAVTWFAVPMDTLGHVIATATIASVRRIDDIPEAERTPLHVGPWCWELDDVRPLVPPVPAKGRLGLWDVDVSP